MSTEHQLVRLNVPKEWTPRYLAASYHSKSRREQPSKFSYDDEAFPRFKPELSVFYGPPSISRKERGWYRVVRWPQADSSPHVVPFRTGADLPPELVQHVIDQLIPKSLWVEVQKRDLNTCALVCRHWARICRPAVFRGLILRNRNDVVHLITFVQSPISIIRDYLHIVRLVSNPGDRPWIHFLSTSLYPLLPPGRLLLVSLKIEGPLSSSLPSIRSVHPTLPRSPPASFSTRIAYLTLGTIHFPRIDSLVRLVRELPDLTSFTGEQLTWPHTTPTVGRGWLRRTTRQPSVFVTLDRCSDYWVAAWLAVVEVIDDATDRSLRLSSDDYVQFATLIDTVGSCFSNLVSVKLGRDMYVSTPSRAWQVKFQAADSYLPNVVLQLFGDATNASPGNSGTLRLHALSLHVKPYALEAVRRLDWARFDKAASALPDIQRVTVVFDSFADFDKFSGEHLDQKLVQLSLAGKLCLKGFHMRR